MSLTLMLVQLFVRDAVTTDDEFDLFIKLQIVAIWHKLNNIATN